MTSYLMIALLREEAKTWLESEGIETTEHRIESLVNILIDTYDRGNRGYYSYRI